VQNIQSLVSSIRSEAGIAAISEEINAIADVVGTVVTSTQNAMSSTGNSPLSTQADPIVQKLSAIRQRLIEAEKTGRSIAEQGDDGDEGDHAWKAWNQSLPPIAFEIARETKELVLRVDVIDGETPGRNGGGGGDDDFS
jgi:hypothetical protein